MYIKANGIYLVRIFCVLWRLPADEERLQGNLSEYLYDIQQLTEQVWLSRPILDNKVEDDDMQDIFEEVSRNYKDASDVMDVNGVTDTVLDYVANEFVIKNGKGEVLVMEARSEEKKQFRTRYVVVKRIG